MNILIVSSVFPPDNNVGTLRIMSFSKYLKNNGYMVTVLTKKKSTQCSEKYAQKYFEINEESSENLSAIQRYRVFCRNEKLYKNEFLNIIKQMKVDFVIITGGPFYTFGVAKVARENNIPCNLDFRDPWFFDVRGGKDIVSPSRVLARMVYFIKEKDAVKNATVITTVTSGWLKNFKRLYWTSREKFYLIENGYDDERLSHLKIPCKEQKTDGLVHIAVFGKMFYYSLYFSKMFCNVIMMNSLENKIKIHQIGELTQIDNDIISLSGVNKNVFSSTGFKRYEEGIVELSKYDAFLIIDSRKNALGTKLYDYIYLNKPIIYIGPKKSAIASVLCKLKAAYICNNKSDIKKALDEIYNNKFMIGKSDIVESFNPNRKFCRSIQNERWLDIINNKKK